MATNIVAREMLGLGLLRRRVWLENSYGERVCLNSKPAFALCYLSIEKLRRIFSNAEKGFLISIVLLMTIIVFLGTLVRYLPVYGGMLLLGTEEFGRLSLVWLWLLAGAAVHRAGKHYKLSVLFDRLPSKIRFALLALIDIIVLVFISLLTKYSVQLFVQKLGTATLNLQWPAIIFILPLLIGCPLIGVYTLIRLVSRIKRAIPRK